MNTKLFAIGVVSVITVFSFLYYQSFFLDRSQSLSYITEQFANAVGVNVGVEENQYNTVAQQLREKEKELDNRERSLLDLEREIITQISEERKSQRVLFLYVSVVGSVLMVFLVLNFYFDMKWRRGKRDGLAN